MKSHAAKPRTGKARTGKALGGRPKNTKTPDEQHAECPKKECASQFDWCRTEHRPSRHTENARQKMPFCKNKNGGDCRNGINHGFFCRVHKDQCPEWANEQLQLMLPQQPKRSQKAGSDEIIMF